MRFLRVFLLFLSYVFRILLNFYFLKIIFEISIVTNVYFYNLSTSDNGKGFGPELQFPLIIFSISDGAL